MQSLPSDEEIGENAERLLQWSANLDAAAIQVLVADGVAILSGSVPTYSDREAAEQVIGILRGVQEVKNELAVVPTETWSDEMIAKNTWGVKDVVNVLNVKFP